MKKVFLAFGVGAMLLSTTACGNSNATSEADRAANDSISELFGVVVGSQFAQEINHMPEMNKDAFLRGISTAVLADTSDVSYLQGLSQGARIAQQFQYFYNEMGVDIDRDLFLKHFKKAILADTVGDVVMQQTMLNQMMEAAQKRAEERKEAELNNAPEAVANRAAGVAYIDSIRKADPAVQVTPSGLAYKVVAAGEGDNIKEDDMASVIYKGSLADGTVFDDSKGEARRFSPRRVVPGFGEGLQMMNKGAKYVLYIPGDLAYGVKGMPQAGIGPNQLLIFDVEIADIDAKK
ncbi:FKBP-type peptidyl-prolyl cis-trans isomerase [uncultured Muribaculum sp.]|uniref:FKBP-type peptidyl-prolyl cis-trans isomerase n=1 Tax=uncultured Muribaculum sp. TaxID=1918613 RepID=UPI0025988CD2|nr:FKBP-type peptidyl-prolyl cis-trans isomerase [uncultured Muribaculum sp.]